MKLNERYHRAVHWVAILATAFTLPLLYVGGSVTTYQVGLAVPDWPTTFEENMFLYNFWDAPFGVKIEHAHRLYGAAVGFATIVLAGCLLAFERRRWLKGLGILALVAVVIQGVLGGMRVTQRSTMMAAIHGSTGQAFFGLMVALCVLTGRDWNSDRPRSVDPDHLRRKSSVVLALIYLQIGLGGWLRHYGTSIGPLDARALRGGRLGPDRLPGLPGRTPTARDRPAGRAGAGDGSRGDLPGDPRASHAGLRVADEREPSTCILLRGRHPDGPSDERRSLVCRGDRPDFAHISSSGRCGERRRDRGRG